MHESQIFDPANVGTLALSAFETLRVPKFLWFLFF